MKALVIGGGITGLATAWFLAREGVQVRVLESQSEVGGLSVACKFPEFYWDRFYHCILPSDRHLLGLVNEIGLGNELRWVTTQQGFWIEGGRHPMNGPLDLLRFPALRLVDKVRLGAMAALAPRFGRTDTLDLETSAAWLQRWCGQRGWQRFWRHLLRAKLGSACDWVSARFIHATITRLISARRATGDREMFGYVRGGYRRILDELATRLHAAGVRFETSLRARRVVAAGDEVRVHADSDWISADFAVITLPNPAVAGLIPQLDEAERQRLADTPYLGVACTVVTGHAPLSANYILNLCDDSLRLTGIIEMTNVISRTEETAGRTLVYLPRYAPVGDALFEMDDDSVAHEALADLARVYPQTRDRWVESVRVHRAKFIQAIPRAGAPPIKPAIEAVPGRVYVANNAQLDTCVLNNNDCIGHVERAVREILEQFRRSAATRQQPEVLVS